MFGANIEARKRVEQPVNPSTLTFQTLAPAPVAITTVQLVERNVSVRRMLTLLAAEKKGGRTGLVRRFIILHKD